MRWWYPRLWDRWATEKTDERPEPFFAGERDVSIKDGSDSLDLRTLDPPFVQEWAWNSDARVANELEYRIYDSLEPIADVIPEGSQQLAQRIVQGMEQVRLSQSGLVHLATQDQRRMYFTIPSAQEFMLAWLQTQGWKAQLSSPGLIARQILKCLKGKFGIHMIDYEGIIRLIDHHASERADPNNRDTPRAPKWIEESVLLGKLDRILREEKSLIKRDRYLQGLLERDVLRLGLQLHCPTWARWMWKPIDQLDEQIECEQCLTKFSISAAPRKEREWSYRPIGPFNVRGFAGGAYTVLLTWKFFEGHRHRPTTPLFSFTATKNNHEIEVDLALFCRDQEYHGQKNHTARRARAGPQDSSTNPQAENWIMRQAPNFAVAYRIKTAARREAAPNRRRFPKGFKLNRNTPLKGTMIYLRRSDDQGNVPLLAQTFPVAEHWVHRLVRCEVDFREAMSVQLTLKLCHVDVKQVFN